MLYACFGTEAELYAQRENLNQQLSTIQRNIQDLEYEIELQDLEKKGIICTYM
jgi:hypothetical protein